MKGKEIIHANIKVTHKKKQIKITDIVILSDDKIFNNKRVLKKYGIKDPIAIDEIEVISSLGFQNSTSEFATVKKSDEKRNEITGAYE